MSTISLNSTTDVAIQDMRMKESFDSMPTFSYQGQAPPSVALPINRLAIPEGHQMGSPIVSGLIMIAEDNRDS